MKKIVVYTLVLCLVLNLSFFNPVFAENNYLQAAEILFELGFMEKIEDEPALDTVVSRADFAVMVVKMLGAEQKTNKLYFEDVPANYFAKDAISTAFELGIINGVDEKHFAPDEPLSYEQAVKILVTALGYKLQAESKGGYPFGYMLIAKNLDITDNIDATNKHIVRRGIAAQLIVNSLNVNIPLDNTYGEDNIYTFEDGVNILSERHDIIKSEGIVRENSVSSFSGSSGLDEGFVKIGNTLFKTGKTDARSLLGHNVIYYADTEEEPYTLIYIAVNDKKCSSITLLAENIITGRTNSQEITYEINGRQEKAELAANHCLIKDSIGLRRFFDASDVVQNSVIKCIDNNNDRKYDVIMVYNLKTIVAGSVNSTDYMVTDSKNPLLCVELKPDDEDYASVIFSGDKTVDFKAIKEGSTLLVSESTNTTGRKQKTVFLSDRVVSGMLEAAGDEDITISSDTYNVKPDIRSTISPYIGREITGYIDAFGRIAAIGEDADGLLKYGYIINAAPEGTLNSKILFKLISENGGVETFEGAKNMTLDATGGYTAREVYDKLPSTAMTGGNGIEQLVRYKSNSKNQITLIDTTASDAGGDFDTLTRNLEFKDGGRRLQGSSFDGKFTVDDKTLVFFIPSDTNDDEDYSVTDKSYFVAATNYDTEVYDLSEAVCAKVLLMKKISEENATISSAALPGIITDVKRGRNVSGEDAYIIQFTSNGKNYKYATSSEAVMKINSTTTFAEGDIIRYSLNDKGEIMKLEATLAGAAKNTATMGYQGFGVNSTTFYASVGCTFGYLSDMDGLNVAISDKADDTGTKYPYVLSSGTVTFIYHVQSGELEKSSVSVLPKYLYGNDPSARVALITRGAGPYQIYIYDFN